MNPPPQATALPPLPPLTQSHVHNPKPSLSTALSTLTSLIDLSTTTLLSVPTTPASTDALLPCPFNPTHHVPPSSLFSHYLRCPSSVSLPRTLRYPGTLNAPPSSEFHFPSNSSELCFSLESYFDHNSPVNNFFYQSCPGPVVLVNNDHSIPPPPSLTLPRVLYIECANFNEDCKDALAVGLSVDDIGFLPSEIWAIQNELQGWAGGVFPSTYSFRVLRAILRLQGCMLLRLHDWVVVNSPKYGVIIDFYMRDHMIWLVKFCLKAIMREAFGLAGFLFSDVEIISEDESLGLGNQRYECPVLFNVLMWLASQFGILYGEASGKFFTLDVFKECIMESSSNASLFPVEGKDADSGDLYRVEVEIEEQTRGNMPMDNGKRNDRDSISCTVGSSMIFISQVAAAVAALLERSMVEGNIRALRCSQPLSAYQRNMEHAYVSKIADEERQRRSDYRPIIEHDGLLWQRSRNQDANKIKTREELLAEERDYKRRRMSYRGKKLKRNTTEVIRDIIEEYMEEIKQAGGIDSLSKTAEEADISASEYSYRHESASVVSGLRNHQMTKDYEDQSHDNRHEFHSRHDSEDFMDGVLAQRRDSSWHSSLRDFNGNTERVGHGRDDNSRSREERHGRSQSREQMDSGKRTDNVEIFEECYSTRSRQSRTPHERNSHKKERGEGDQSSRKREGYEENREYRDRGKSKTSRDRRDREKDTDVYRDRGRSKRNQDRRDREEDNSGHWDRGKSKINRGLRDVNEDIGEHRNRWRSRTDKNIQLEDRYDPVQNYDDL
ncbi:U11/U12 small nuclear ribonucleoprotein 48 kDa protein-like [Primulina huaijiensis]|uniref:U11/U12 small nuclear ribonucleoprotein 48 kDa protein-like n=1 Tax=Primulina huaijiensis TaxID=1492673 RepID=UPI003CC77E62